MFYAIPPHHLAAPSQKQGKREGSLSHYRGWNRHSCAPCQSAGTGPRNLAPSEPYRPLKSHSRCNLASGAVEDHACCQSLGSPSATLPWICGWSGEQIAGNNSGAVNDSSEGKLARNHSWLRYLASELCRHVCCSCHDTCSLVLARCQTMPTSVKGLFLNSLKRRATASQVYSTGQSRFTYLTSCN